jgi:hypothetical protein
MSTMQFAALVLAHDPIAPAKIACHIDVTAPSANDDNWSRELDNDPGYAAWMEEQAEMEEMRHARW